MSSGSDYALIDTTITHVPGKLLRQRIVYSSAHTKFSAGYSVGGSGTNVHAVMQTVHVIYQCKPPSNYSEIS